jgi:hypothetical protein
LPFLPETGCRERRPLSGSFFTTKARRHEGTRRRFVVFDASSAVAHTPGNPVSALVAVAGSARRTVDGHGGGTVRGADATGSTSRKCRAGTARHRVSRRAVPALHGEFEGGSTTLNPERNCRVDVLAHHRLAPSRQTAREYTHPTFGNSGATTVPR